MRKGGRPKPPLPHFIGFVSRIFLRFTFGPTSNNRGVAEKSIDLSEFLGSISFSGSVQAAIAGASQANGESIVSGSWSVSLERVSDAHTVSRSAVYLKGVASKLKMDGQPVEGYMQLLEKHQGNVRAALQEIASGKMRKAA